MALSYEEQNGNNTTGPYHFNFKWLEATDINVSVNGVVKTVNVDYTLTNINLTTKEGGSVLFTNAVLNSETIRIYRTTDSTDLTATFYAGSALRAQDLNTNFLQSLFITQETQDITVQASTGNLADGSITNNLIANGAVTTTKIADSNVTEVKLSFTPLKSTDIGVTVQGYDATTLKSADIGTTVQAYDADTAKLDVAQTFTADQTFTATQTYPKIPQNAKTAAYTLVAADAGKHISITTGGITVPSGVFAVGDAVSIYNNSGSSQTITQGASTTLRLAGSASTGNRTLSQYGLCTILCVASNTFVVSGAIVS